jgi:hypothetical protein
MPEESQNVVLVPSAISTGGLLASALATAASTRPVLAASISAGSATTAVCGSGTAVALGPRSVAREVALRVAPLGPAADEIARAAAILESGMLGWSFT